MEVRSEWAKCCCCTLSVSKTSGRLKWCADSENWKHSKCLKLMLTITIIFLPVAVISLSILKYTNSLQKPINVPLPDSIQISVSDTYEDLSENTRHTIIHDYHATSCLPPAKGSYSVRTKRSLHSEPYMDTNSSKKEDNLKSFGESIEKVSELTNEENNLRNTKGSLEVDSAALNNFKKTIDFIQELKESLNRSLQRELSGKKEILTGHEARIFSTGLEESFWGYKGDRMSTREAQARIMKQNMDMKTDPCQDFYQFACGNWDSLNPIPKDKANFDTFEKLRESLDIILRDLLEEGISKEDTEAYIKAKNFYRSCYNHEILRKRGVKPLIKLLNSLGGWPMITANWNSSKFDWQELMAQLRLYNNDVLISGWVGPDIKNSSEIVIQFDQTSLGLPTREYYLQPSYQVYIEAYTEYMIKIARLLGTSPETASFQAEEIVKFETALAQITAPSDERRNVTGLYKRTNLGNLKVILPKVDWQKYLTVTLNRHFNDSQPIVIFAIRYVRDLVSLIEKTPPRTVANYLLWRFVRHRVNNLDDRFQDAKQEFYYVLVGRERSPPRWKNCVMQVNNNLGMALGAMFVHKYFDENSKNDTLSMTKEIQHSFKDILQSTNWIGGDTRNLASEKVDTMVLKVGYPDYILSSHQLNDRYKDVTIHPDEYFENTLNLLQHLTRVDQALLGTAVNKSVWNSAPAIVNAYYSRNKNQIMFPAGILQPPFYHKHFPRSLNYGGIGVVIGHEITHGFDDKGRLFDKSGNLQRWWKDDDIRRFHDRAHCLIEQYGKYVVQEVGIPLDGINTQGENIADNGGIKQAYRAYQRWLLLNENEDETLPGLNATGNQLFFLNFAQVWCGSTRPEASRNSLKTAAHSPGRFRVIGTLSNSDDFARVYNCPQGSPMNPAKKCSVW